jgi:hypothetical protein
MLFSKLSLRLLLPGLLVLFAVGAVAGADALPEAAGPGLERAVEVSGHEVLPVRAGQPATETDEELVEPEPDEELVEPQQLDPDACVDFGTHGECVSDAARNICEPGPEHGTCVREFALLNHGQTKDEAEAEVDAEGSSTSGRPEHAGRPDQAGRPDHAVKPATAGRP